MLAFFGSLFETWMVEIAWSTVAAVGLIFSLYNLTESLKDFGAISYFNIKNGRRFIARSSVIIELSRTIIQGIALLIGIWVMSLPKISNYPQPENIFIFGLIFKYGLLTIVTLLSFNTYLSFKSRIYLMTESLLLHNGSKGDKGDKGEQGIQGTPGIPSPVHGLWVPDDTTKESLPSPK